MLGLRGEKPLWIVTFPKAPPSSSQGSDTKIKAPLLAVVLWLADEGAYKTIIKEAKGQDKNDFRQTKKTDFAEEQVSLPISKVRQKLNSLSNHQIQIARKTLAGWVCEFYHLMAKDLMIGFFFSNRDLVKISQNQTSFLLKAMGLETAYQGKSIQQAHVALPPIRKGQFFRRIELLNQHLKEKKLPNPLIHAWLEFERSFEHVVLS